MSHKPPLPQSFPLSKVMHAEVDYPELEAECAAIKAGRGLEGQHPVRLWEYAMAHRALREWDSAPRAYTAGESFGAPLQLVDVGGASSRFAHTLQAHTTAPVWVVDPSLTADRYTSDEQDIPDPGFLPHGKSIEEFAATAAHNWADAIFALSVLEHVPTPMTFLRACRMLLKPGGLLVLTMDCWDCDGPDLAHFHWMRERIYNPGSIMRLQITMREIGFKNFGRSDWEYHGAQVYDYSVAAVAMTRKP